MYVILWILLALIILGALLLLLVWAGLKSGISNLMAPNTEVQSINVVKGTLGFDFGNEYEVVTHISRNYHPDRPMEIVVQLSDEAFKRMRSFLEGLKLEKTETISEDGKTKYVNTWQKKEHVFSKRHTASHFQQDGHDYTFFSATLTIDLDSKLIAHAETGI